MKLPTIKRILREDVKEAPSWVNGLIDPLNTFMETVYQALNKNLTLNENIASFTTDLTYKTPTTYPTGQENANFRNDLKSNPIGVQLLQVYDKATYLPPPGPVFIPWIVKDTQIIIYPVTGLEANKTYLVRLLVY